MFSFFRIARLSLQVACLLLLTSSVCSARIEAVKGKRYQLSPQHGPWMVLVAAIRDVPEERRTPDGLSAWEAADRIVYELRKLGIPAYTYLQDMQVGQVKAYSPRTGADDRKYIARHEAIAVLAGNFSSPDDRVAKKVLTYLKESFDPDFLKDRKNGGLFAVTPGRPKPFSRAHMTTNPLMPQSEVRKRTVDPLVRRLNSDMEHSLLKNSGRYSLRIATFRGNAIVQVGNTASDRAEKHFNSAIGDNLDESARKAWELTEALRSARKFGYDRDFDAYVFHDRYESYVTVGSFDSMGDPRIAEMARRFHGKQREYQGKDVTTAEVFTIPKNTTPGVPPEKFWMFDLKPQLIEVPKLR